MDLKKTVPAIDGLITWPSDDPHLIASKCQACGNIRFPSGKTCNNPSCKDRHSVIEVDLSKKGKVFTYMVQHYQPPPPFKITPPFKPFGVGLVELPEGIRVLGMITGCDVNDIKIGMEVEMVVEKLYEDEQGNDVVTWKWKKV